MRRKRNPLAWSEFVIVRLLRRWAAGRASDENPLPGLVGLARTVGEPAEVAIALHSLFQLTESCLARPLEAECCCSPVLSPDERAVLALIAAAPVARPPVSSPEIPHGLPGALLWAAATVRLALRVTAAPAPRRCPFAQATAAPALTTAPG